MDASATFTAATGTQEFRDAWLTTSAGSRLYYRDYGPPVSPRAPLLCLPGLARNSHDYHAFAIRHAADRRVVCPDYRGRGRSDRARDWRDYAPPATLDDLRQLVAATGLRRMIVVGTSFGGLLATALGVTIPRALAGVVLNDIGPAVESGAQGQILSHIAAARGAPDWPSAVQSIREVLPDLSFQTEEAWLDFARGTYEPDEGGGLRARWDPLIVKPYLSGGVETPDLWALFRSLSRIPVLLVRGGRSPVLTTETARKMAEAHPGLRECLVPQAGHAPTLVEPESRAAVAAFFDEIDRSGPV